MSAKIGRPSDNPRINKISIRIDNDHHKILESYCERNKINKTGAISNGIEKLYIGKNIMKEGVCMKFFDQRKVINALLKYDKNAFVPRDFERTDNEIFASYGFIYQSYDGYVTMRYDGDKDIFTSVTVGCNFDRPAGLNNYREAESLARHLKTLFGW